MASPLFNQKLMFLAERLEQIWRQADELPQTLGNLWQQADEFPGQTQELLRQNLQELSLDLSQLQQISEELRQQNEALAENFLEFESEFHKYVELFEFAPDGYLVTDKYAHVLKANRAAAELLSMSQEQLVNKPLVTFIASQERSNFRSKLNQLQQGTSLKHWQVQMQPRHGATYSALFTVVPVPNLQGQVEEFRWRLMDWDETPSEQPSSISNPSVPKTKSTALSPVREDKTLNSQSFYTFVNETRNPLNTILVSAQLIEAQTKSSTDKNHSHLIGLIQDNAKRINQLLNDMLLIEKLKTQQISLNPILLDLNRFCGKLIAELQQSVGKEHKIAFLCPEQSYPARIDEQVLQYILRNLLLTLIKYSLQQSEIHLQIDYSPQKVKFIIQILGRGISQKDKELLSNWLERANHIETKQQSDLNLAIVHHCIALYKGKVSVESKVESKTTLTLTLPVLPEGKRKRAKL